MRKAYFFVLHFVKVEGPADLLEHELGLLVGEAVQVEGALVELHGALRLLLLRGLVLLLPLVAFIRAALLLRLLQVLLYHLLFLRITEVGPVVALSVVQGRSCLRSALSQRLPCGVYLLVPQVGLP